MVQASEESGGEIAPSDADGRVVGESLISGYRKYIAFWVAFISSMALLIFGKLDGGEYVDIQIVIFGLYMAGNVGEHMAYRRYRRGQDYGGSRDW